MLGGSFPLIPFATVSREALRGLIAKSAPFIVDGIPGVEAWNLGVLRRALGDGRFETGCSAHNRAKRDKTTWNTLEYKRMARFSRYAEILEDGTAARLGAYMAQIPMVDELIAKLPDVAPMVDMLPPSTGAHYNFWCGPGGVVSDLHFDSDDGFLFQVVGNKQFTMLPPTQSTNLYPFPRGRAIGAHFSMIDDIDAPDLIKFPRVAEALPFRETFTLRAGQAVFIPAGWWHKVVSLGSGMLLSLSRWFRGDGHQLPPPVASESPTSAPGVDGRVVTRRETVKASVARVVAAINDEQAIRRWWNTTFRTDGGVGVTEFTFMSQLVELKLQVERAPDGTSWRFLGPHDHWVMPWGGSTARVRVEANGADATSIEVVHDGFGPAAQLQQLAVAAGLWGHFLESLKLDLETGEGLAWGEW
jgi:lysine-specific demethylase 8/hypoxia-inducible factor 1-alpha inhibitor (HIF hydroxylase)